MTGTVPTIIQPRLAKFGTNGVSIGIDNRCFVTMSHLKQVFQDKFDVNGVSIGIDSCCSVTMSHFKQDFVVTI